MALRGKRLGLAVWGVAMWAIMIFGYNQSAAGGVLVTKSFNEQFPEMDTLFTTGKQQKHNSTIQGTVVALYTLCGTFGALACSALGDVFGRRRTIFTAAATSGIGAVLMTTSYSFAQFIVARMVTGFGTGGIIATVSVWQSELSRPSHRGSHVSGFGIFCGAGLALATWVDFGLSFASGSVSWRFPLSVPAIAALVVMGTIFTAPESPRWLIKAKRVDEARDIISRIHDTTVDDHIVWKETYDIQRSLELGGQASLTSIFKMGPGRTLHRVILAVTIQMFLQLSGINSVAYYAPAVFQQQLHFSPVLSSILAASSQLCLVLGAVICSFTVDRFGRRKLMLGSAASMAICMALLAGLTSDSKNTSALKGAVAFVYLYYLVYVLGFLGIPFLYASEIAPGHLRGPICGISTAASWLFNFLVVEVTPVAFTDIGSKYFIVYAVINAVCVFVVYFFYPETSGRSLEEIDAIFVSSNTVFDPVRVARSKPVANSVVEEIEARQANIKAQKSKEDKKELDVVEV